MSDAAERIPRARGVSDPKLEESPRVVEPGAGILPLHTLPDGVPAPAGDRVTRLAIRETGRTYFIPVATIDWIEGADYYVKLHVGAETHLFRETMNAVEAKLDPDLFFRIHRSHIVNIERVKELQPWFNGEYVVCLKSGARLTLSRGYREKLQERIGRTL